MKFEWIRRYNKIIVLVISFLIILKFIQTLFGFIVIFIYFIFILLYLWFNLQKEDSIKIKISLGVITFIAAIITLQGSIPVFAPKLDISVGDTTYGFVYENYTTTYREFKIDVSPPLFLTNIDRFNCRDYDLMLVNRGEVNVLLEPLKINLTNPSSEFPGFYKTIQVCLNPKTNIDAWSLGKLSTSVYLVSKQPVRALMSNTPNNGNDSGTIHSNIERLNKLDDNRYYMQTEVTNIERFPVSFITTLKIENNTPARDSLRELVVDKNCRNVLIYPVLDLNNLTKINIREVSREWIMYNNSITFGDMGSFLKIYRLNPGETQMRYLIFECER